MNYAGQHVFTDARLDVWPGDAAVMAAAERAIAMANMTVIACTHKRFTPQGLTAVWILAESHFTIHTYPEHRYISADCYTCGDEGDPMAAIMALLAELGGNTNRTEVLIRGDLPKA